MSGLEKAVVASGGIDFPDGTSSTGSGLSQGQRRLRSGSGASRSASGDSSATPSSQLSPHGHSLDLCCMARLTSLPTITAGAFSIKEIENMAGDWLMVKYNWMRIGYICIGYMCA